MPPPTIAMSMSRARGPPCWRSVACAGRVRHRGPRAVAGAPRLLRGCAAVAYSRRRGPASRARPDIVQEEIEMLKRSHALTLLVAAVLVLAGCAAKGSTGGMQPVPITDFKMVAGRWAGPVTGITSRDDWAEMTITPEGRFDFGIARTIGVFSGGGDVTLADGEMHGEGERG